MPLPWGDPLAREPFDRYKETERQRTGNFISSIVSRAQTRSLERISGVQPMLRTPPKKKKNFLDRTISAIDKATPEFSEDIGKGALKAISTPQEYVGKPLFAISSGQLGARQQTGENGQTYRRFDPSWSDFGRGIKKLATQDPRDTYNEARQAFDEARADPNKSRWKGAAADALSDPLTYVPIGGVSKLGAKAPLALKAGKVGKVGRGAAALLETAPRTAAYGVAGSSLGAELAPKVGLPEWVGTVGGGIGGGILSVKAPRTPRMDLNASVVDDAVPPPASQVDNFGAGVVPEKPTFGKQATYNKVPHIDVLFSGDNGVGDTYLAKRNGVWHVWEKGEYSTTGDFGRRPETIVGGPFESLREAKKWATENVTRKAKPWETTPTKSQPLADIAEPPGPAQRPDVIRSSDPMDATMAEITAAKRGQLPPPSSQFDTPSSTALTPASTGVSEPAAAPPNAGGGASAGFDGPGGVPSPPPGPLPSQPGKKPARDMLNTIERGDRLAEELKHHQTLRGKIETVARKGAAKVGGTKADRNLVQDDLVTPFIVKERNRLDNLVGSYEGEADDLFAQMETALKGAFTVEPDGSRRMLNGATFSDMFERKTELGRQAYNDLSNPQVAAIERMRDFGDELNANLRYHNKTGTLGWDNSLDDYFPRVAVGKDGTPFARFGDSRAIGSKKPFMKDRTFATFEEGLKNNINYADERQAWRMATRAKLRVASDDYIAKNILPLGLKKKQIPPGLNIGTDYVQIPRDVAPALQGRYFEKDVAERIIATLQPNPVVDLKFITGINRALTPLRATGDISWLFQQGLPMVYRHPIKAAKGALGVINSATFGDRKAYDRLMESVNWNKREAIEHGLYWTGQDLPSADHGLVKVGSRFTEKPVIGTVAKGYNKMADFSNETFGRYMNYVRATFAGDAQERLAKMKPNMDPLEYRREYQKAMSAVNRLSGNTGRKVTSLESTFAFAPRYFSASVEQLAAAVSKGGLEGSIARRHMFNMLMTGGAFVAAVNASRGFETSFDPKDEDFLKLKFDPRKMKETEWNILDPKTASNFLRARDIGGLDVSPFGTYDTLFRAIAMTAVGDDEGGGPDLTKLWKLAEGKMSPGLKLVYEPLIRKSTYSGEPLDPTSIKGWADIAGKQAVAAAPFSIQNLIDEGITPSIEERSVKPLVKSLPGLAASAAGATNNPVTPTEYRNWRRDEVALEKYGVKYDELKTGAEKSIVNEDAQVQKYQEEADKNTLTRGDDLSINQAAAIENRAAVEALTEAFDRQEIRGSEFRQRYRDLQNRLRGARSVLKQREGDKEIEGYFKLFDDATRADMSLDYEMLEPLLAEYEAAHPEVLAKVEAITGTQDNAVMREFRVARKEAQEYYELPAYAGLTAAEGEAVRPILDITRSLVSNNRARDYRHALAILMEMDYITEADARLAIMATKGGSSPERKQYRLTHPTFAKFYLDDIETLSGNELPSLNAFPDAPKRARRTASRVGLREVKRTVRRSA